MKYEILEHKADLKIRAFGKTKEELFLNMLLGMQENMKGEPQKPEEKTRRAVCIKSLDFPSLLVDFLNETIYLNQINKEIYFKAEFKKFSGNEIEGELIGRKIAIFGEDIKAATHHNLEILQKEGVLEATVLFDI